MESINPIKAPPQTPVEEFVEAFIIGLKAYGEVKAKITLYTQSHELFNMELPFTEIADPKSRAYYKTQFLNLNIPPPHISTIVLSEGEPGDVMELITSRHNTATPGFNFTTGYQKL